MNNFISEEDGIEFLDWIKNGAVEELISNFFGDESKTKNYDDKQNIEIENLKSNIDTSNEDANNKNELRNKNVTMTSAINVFAALRQGVFGICLQC